MTAQIVAYERKGNSAAVWRCFSHDTKAEVPGQIEGLRVTEAAPYAFSAHMDERMFLQGVRSGKIQIHVPEALRMTLSQQPFSLGKTAGPQDGGGLRVAGAAAVPGTPEDPEQLLGTLPPALCGDRVEKIVLPPSLVRVGRYCFYNCAKLRSLEFTGTLADWGSGVFTGCHRVRRLQVHVRQDKASSLKQVLDELPEELLVEYEQESGPPARLVFPEFYEEGVENTPARILETHVHGTGMLYRNCFQGRVFDFRQYDSLFPYAVAQESPEAVAQLVIGRLRFPYELEGRAKEQYLEYALKHAQELADCFLAQRDAQGLRWLLGLDVELPGLLTDHVTREASRLSFAEAAGCLMDCRRALGRQGRKRREL